MLRQLLLGRDRVLTADRTVCKAVFILFVFCGTASAQSNSTTAPPTTDNATVNTAVLTQPATSAQQTPINTTTEASTATGTTTPNGATSIEPDTTQMSSGGTTNAGQNATNSTMESSTDDDDGDNETMSSTQMSVKTTQDDSITADATSEPPVMRCYTCNTTNTTDSCFNQQVYNQSHMEACNAGHKCWTTRYDKEDKLINVTRACRSDACTDTHDMPETVSCMNAHGFKRCTQCCETDLCNKHVNHGGVLSGYLSTVALSAVAVLVLLER